ncbi:MAG: carbohydrate ABC transporter permease [Hydrogeniiclostridium sp.]
MVTKSKGGRINYFPHAIDRIFMGFVYFFLISFSLCIIIPVVNIVASSFSSPTAVSTGKVMFWPVEFSVEGYQRIFESDFIMKGLRNTVIYTVVGTTINIIVTVLAAYPLSRKDIKGRNVFMGIFAFTMLFNGGMIPTYLVVKQLGLLNTMWALILPGALSVYNMIICRTYFIENLPWELHECAEIDGCNEIRYLYKIAIPLAKPILAVMVLLYAVGHWNSYFNALIYLTDPEKIPLQLVLRDILFAGGSKVNVNDVAEQLKREYMKNLLQYSCIIFSTVPILLLYPFIQKYFVKGIMIGAIKG